MYANDPDKKIERIREEYANDPDKQRERKREEYANDPDKQRNRKREEYDTDQELMTSMDMLKKYEKSCRYGPSFPCVSCHQYKWRREVTEFPDVRYTDQNLLDVDYVIEKNRCFFLKQGSFYICSTCKSSIRSLVRPVFSALNGLRCPWEDVPKDLLSLTNVSGIFNLKCLQLTFLGGKLFSGSLYTLR